MVKNVLAELKADASAERAKANAWFFKTGPGEYGEGDKFWGLTVPQVRIVAKIYKDIPLDEILLLLRNEVHEVRLCAVLMLVARYPKDPDNVYKFYLENTKYINNWDLVDASAWCIVGHYLFKGSRKILFVLARSKNIWERRIAIIASFYFIKQGDAKDALKIAEMLIDDKHDLIRKAVGWMLREIGKRCSREIEEEFLGKYASTMPRVTLRYAIEHFPEEKKKYFMGLKSAAI